MIDSIFCNRFTIRGTAALVRFTFSDQIEPDGEANDKASVMMTRKDAEEMHAILGRILKEIKQS